MVTQIEPRKFSLLENGEAELVVDYSPPLFRCAFYFTKPGQKTRSRVANADKSFNVALQKCFKEVGSPFVQEPWAKARLIEEYIRATPWGESLPH